MKPISFVTIIKNRTRITVDHNGTEIELRLFENNLNSLISLITPSDSWEYVIVDFESTDVNMREFIDTLPKKDNLVFKIFTIKDTFDKGAGLNYASDKISNDIVFFLDADMMIKTRKLFDDIETFVVRENKVLFPICVNYNDPTHSHGYKAPNGKGNVIQWKNTIMPYRNNKKWGEEDVINFNYFEKLGQAYRTCYHNQFIHQWHPPYIRHIHYTRVEPVEPVTS